MTNQILTAEERRDAWGFEYNGDHHFWDYAAPIAEVLLKALERVERLVGPETAAVPFRQLVDIVAVTGGYSDAETWRDVMEDTLAAGTVWPISQSFHDAGLYGYYGVTPADVPDRDRSLYLERLVKEVTEFAAGPEVMALWSGNALDRIARIAASRLALDKGVGEVDVGSMAILGGVSEGRLRNLMSGADAALERGPTGGIVAASALAWLMKRKEFYHSIWNEPEAEPEDEPPAPQGELIFVPVARDGSTFHPGLLRAGQFQIGAKGEEQHFDSFEEALAALNAMAIPRWRRPNEQGNWGIVSGVNWTRIERVKIAQG